MGANVSTLFVDTLLTHCRAYAHIRHLTGTVAPKAKLQQIVYMASRFSDRIQKVMNVSGYHAGDNILVEVDLGNTNSVCTWH